MNLNDPESFHKLDQSDMLAQIDQLPQQLSHAWELGTSTTLPHWEGLQNVLVAGMGGSAIGADLLAAYITKTCPIPVIVHRDYELPAWADGPRTLVITSSHSGNTEETLSAYQRAHENQCHILAVTTGGQLANMAERDGSALWRFKHTGQPRAAIGYSFGLLLAAFSQLGLIPDQQTELDLAVKAMLAQQSNLSAEVPDVKNPAKRLAGQMVNRWVAVIGSDLLVPVARRWKGQISEIAKAWGQFEELPEVNHNTLAGILNPASIYPQMMVLFLKASANHQRNQLRSDLTRQIFMLEGIGTDTIEARGDTPLEQLWTAVHLGDYVAYYLAMVYGVDPTPVEAIEGFKVDLQQAG